MLLGIYICYSSSPEVPAFFRPHLEIIGESFFSHTITYVVYNCGKNTHEVANDHS